MAATNPDSQVDVDEDLAWIANLFGEEHAHDFDELAVQIHRRGLAPEGEGGHLQTLDVYDLGGDIEPWLAQVFGGGQYELKLTRRSRFQTSTTIRVAGQPIPKSDAMKRLWKLRNGESPENPDPEGEEDSPEDPAGTPFRYLGPNPFAQGNWPPFLQKPKDASEAAQIIEAMRAFQPPDQSASMTGLIGQLMSMQSGRDEMWLKFIESSKPREESGKSGSELALQMIREISKTQMESMRQNHDAQLRMITSTSEMMGKMVSSGMGSFMKLLTDIVRDSQKDPDGLLDKLPGLLGQVMAPLQNLQQAGKFPQLPSMPAPKAVAGTAPPSPATHPLADARSVNPQAGPSSAEDGGQAAGGAAAPAQATPAANETVGTFLQVLVFGVQNQPDAYTFWEQAAENAFNWMPKSARAAIEGLDFQDPKASDQLLAIFRNHGIPQEALEGVVKIAAGTDGGLDWLREFWAAAPWIEGDDDEQDDEDDEDDGDNPPPQTRPAPAPRDKKPAEPAPAE